MMERYSNQSSYPGDSLECCGLVISGFNLLSLRRIMLDNIRCFSFTNRSVQWVQSNGRTDAVARVSDPKC